MKLNLETGTYLQIGGELGKYNSLPIDKLVKIAQDFQELIKSIAQYDLPTKDTINMDNFKIELVGFKKGSAVPQFAFTPRAENKVGAQWQVHRNIVNEKFERIVEIAHSGNYYQLNDYYPEPIRRNTIVENLYSFVNGFGNTPVSFVDFDDKSDKIIPIYKIHKFKSAVKKELIAKIQEPKDEAAESDEVVGKIKLTKTGNKTTRKIISTYSKSKYSLEYAPTVIVFEGKKYNLRIPLRCLFEKEDGYYIIQSDLLGIMGTGKDEDEAEASFSEEFDYIFNRYNSLEDKNLTKNNLLIKNLLNHLVETIEP